MRNLVLHRVVRGSEPSAEWCVRIAARGGCAGQSVQISTGGSTRDIAIPFDSPATRGEGEAVWGGGVKLA